MKINRVFVKKKNLKIQMLCNVIKFYIFLKAIQLIYYI